MSVINIAFSGGLESTALLQKALREGYEVNVCMINVHGNYNLRLPELIACEKIIEVYRKKIQEDTDYYPGKIIGCIHTPVPPWVSCHSGTFTLATFNVTQQFSTALGMMAIRREQMSRYMPSTWIGWIKEDTSDYDFHEMAFSEKEYQELLDLPKTIGSLSNADNIGISFRAPLWDVPKAEIYASIDDDVKPLIIPNGSLRISADGDKVSIIPHEDKVEEWKKAGIYNKNKYARVDGDWELMDEQPLPAYTYRVEDASFLARYLSGLLLPSDVGLEDTVTARALIKRLSPFFAKGRTIFYPDDYKRLQSEITEIVKDIIIDAQNLPTI